jgi:pimeloyl-ACP methyl ester carboxylesterase
MPPKTPTRQSLDLNGFRLAYIDRGHPNGKPPVICVHGLTRNARDFDYLGEAMAADRRVIAIDVAGRGGSELLPDPNLYQPPVYAQQIMAALDLWGFKEVDWVGTSMGGLIGMGVASAKPGLIRRLVLNDIGPFLPKAALARIAANVARDPRFKNLDEAEAYYRTYAVSFGLTSDEHWRYFAEISVTEAEDGALRPAFDPRIGLAFQSGYSADVTIWPIWEAVACPALVLRGADSDVLLRPTALGMASRPGVEMVEFPGVGHAPRLFDPGQISVVKMWWGR